MPASRVVAGVVAVVAVVVLAVVVWSNMTATRESPGNAVLDFGNDVVLGDHDGAWDRLCARLRADTLSSDPAAGAELAALQEFLQGMGGVSIDGATERQGDAARVPLSVRPRGAADDRSAEAWVATMAREDGRWRVCGYERRTEGG